ncbi:MAG: hypothetical protein V1804_01220 [Patescibacteria group bacterium]
MDLKNYLKIFWKNIFLFLITVFIIVGAGAGYKAYKNSKPIDYQVYLLINITRSGIQSTPDYRYDDFYRLQADERFADTVVRWLESPRIVTDIYTETGIPSGDIGIRDLSKIFKVKRVSSQTVELKFNTANVRLAQDISESVSKIINREAKKLNESQKEDNWFRVIGEEPVIKENKIPWKNVLSISAVIGIFLGIWTVLIKHYLTRE